jgi:multidrug efflux system membrane fusion protein
VVAPKIMACATLYKARSQQITITGAVLLSAAILLLSGCSKEAPVADNTRLVKAMTISADHADQVSEFPGEVKSRVESKLGFRVGGKIIARKVDVGTVVKKGQILMQLDAQDLQLAQRQSEAGLKSATSSRDLALAELHRYRELQQKNFVNQATLDAKETAYQAAQSTYEQAVAASRNQSNQTGYSTLVADIDGVVTAINAEIGQVVAAGTPVVNVAQTDEKEVVIAVPENRVDALRHTSDVRVRLWATPDNVMQGKVREVSPIADAVTRTYTFKVSLPKNAPDVKLGMTAYVTFVGKVQDGNIRLPLTALHEDNGNTTVWLVQDGVAKQVRVTMSGTVGNDVLVSAGVAPGNTIVIAGVHLLTEGQKVRVIDEAPPSAELKVAK